MALCIFQVMVFEHKGFVTLHGIRLVRMSSWAVLCTIVHRGGNQSLTVILIIFWNLFQQSYSEVSGTLALVWTRKTSN